MSIISLKDVCLKYKIEFKENGRITTEDFLALKDINIDIEQGEIVGIIGENGAGKTTLLKIIARMLAPDKGIVDVNGKVSMLMEIGSGFHRELTGRENIYTISSLFGLSRLEIEAKYDDIVKFAAIGRFINAPVKIYSQGMYMRLAFAIAIHVNPDILLVDDIFAVGDVYAQRKCINKMFELKDQGKTIIFVNQDIEILKRFCTKGIFLREGSVVKEGPIDKICDYYMESVGEKKGIAILEKGLLGVVFNNGKLIIRWKNNAITCGFGGYAIVLTSGRQYLSNTADWEIQKSETDNEIIAMGKWPDIPLIQFWKIVFLNEREFSWEITMQMFENNAIEKFCADIIFIDGYKKWFTLDSETSFPEVFIHDAEWEYNLVSESVNKLIGLKGNNQISGSLPVVILDRSHDNMEIKCEVCNTGADIGGRAVRYQSPCQKPGFDYIQDKYRCFLGTVRIFESEKDTNFKNYITCITQTINESYIIRKGLVSLFCKDHKVEIYYRDKLLTSGIGLGVKFKCQGVNYSALDGQWAIHKQNNEEIAIAISWGKRVPFKQTWRIKLQDNDVIRWEIEMAIDEKIKLRNKEVEVVLNEEYEKWIAENKGGDFKRVEKQGSTVLLDKYINEYIGVESLYKAEGLALPGLVFSYRDAVPRASYISKIKERIKATRLWYVEIDSKNNFDISSGRYKYFEGEIKVNAGQEKKSDPVKLINKETVRVAALSNKIESDGMSLVFDNGRGRLFWEEVELTKGLGLYSSIFLKGVYYDSSQAFWEIKKLGQEGLLAIGYWPWLPLTQTWKIYFTNKNTIAWEIKKEIWDDVILEREQVNIMLTDSYKTWSAHKRIHGKFPKTFSEHTGIFWDRMWCGDTASPIKVEKGRAKNGFLTGRVLPAVSLDCSTDCPARYFVIENTDNLFEARVLQCELNSGQKCDTGQNGNKYFEGLIKIVA